MVLFALIGFFAGLAAVAWALMAAAGDADRAAEAEWRRREDEGQD